MTADGDRPLAREVTAERVGFPAQIKFIIGQEAAERFSYYGMTSILTLFMTRYLKFEQHDATATFHWFAMAVYFMPLFGAWISDRFWGKYPTILRLSLLYVVGHAVLSAFESKTGLYVGLALISLGAGGIKPCVSAHVGDQFTQRDKHLIPRVYSLFYFSINFGSFFSTLLMPLLRSAFGPRVAFAVPGVLMGISTFVFWLGRRHYIAVPPTGKIDNGFLRVTFTLVRRGAAAARDRFGAATVEGALAVWRVAKVMVPVTLFWSLFDQKSSSWVLQATRMKLHGLQPDQLQALNPIMVLALIPLFSLGIYPWLERRGVRFGPLRRMMAGMFLAGLSFVGAAIIEQVLAGGARISMFWQTGPYLILTASEVLVSVTGLEFAYTQAPRSLKSTVMSFWMLTIALGNLLTAVVAKINLFSGPSYYLFWAGTMAAVAVVFWALARRYQVVEYVGDVAQLRS